MRKLTLASSVLALALAAFPTFLHAQDGFAEEAPWNYIALKACGVDRFLDAHPDYDGRGVVVFILDNGAEVSAPGLMDTSEGMLKFIDARDFTGEGDVKISKVTVSNDGILESDDLDLRLTGLNTLDLKAEGGAYHAGVLEESRFQNSEYAGAAGTMDVNDNGRDDDRFGLVAFPVAGKDYWAVYVDADLDGDLAGEQALRNFGDFPEDRLFFHRQNPKNQKVRMTFTVRIHPDEEKVVFHYADGAHSTHVSGIVAGYGIDGQAGFNGIAPGARLVSCKIGDCTLSGGATVRESMKKAYEFVRDYYREQKMPVVVNMSYGIGSELEGSTDIDRYIDDLMLKNPGLIVCTSAGNEGPGLSTVGTPAASHMAFSIGAVMAGEVARDVYNADLDGDRLLHFSSRGGELDKPDWVAPGACLSSVPLWRAGSRMWGTSMASPYTAGVVALLLSAARQEFPGVEVTSHMVRRALRNSAKPVKYCGDLDVGRGMIDLPAAWEMLKAYLESAREDPDPLLAYHLETFCPEGAGGKARAAYWRSVYHPGDMENQVFRVKALFHPDASAETINGFMRKFTLVSESPFIKLIPESLPLRQNQAASVTLRYVSEALAAPGIYAGRIAAYEGVAKPENRAFDLLNTVVVPHRFGPGNGYAHAFKDRRVNPLEVDRHYLAVPPGASAMEIKVNAKRDNFALARVELCDPEGRTHAYLRGLDTRAGKVEERLTVKGGDLVPGVWELMVYGDYKAGGPSLYEGEVAFWGVQVLEAPALSLDYKPGKTPKGSAKIMNRFDKAVWADAVGEVWGYGRTRTVKMKDQDTYRYAFHLDDSLEEVRFKITMSPEDFGLFTDFAINIKDGDGNDVAKTGLSYRFTELSFANPGGDGAYTLVMVAGYTHGRKAPFQFDLEEAYRYSEPIDLTVRSPGAGAYIPLIPDILTRVDYTLAGVPPVAPEGFATSASITLTQRGSESEIFRLDLEAKPGGAGK